MIRWTGLAPWEFEFPVRGSLASAFLVATFAFNDTGRVLAPTFFQAKVHPRVAGSAGWLSRMIQYNGSAGHTPGRGNLETGRM